MQERYEYYKRNTNSVYSSVQMIRNMPDYLCFDERYLEFDLIPNLGLNDESLNEQPQGLSRFYGSGLHLWQYPNQLSKYLVWLAHNAKSITSYMEIGCRWGGTFILIMEWLKKIGCTLDFGVAVDLIPPTPFINEYMKICSSPVFYFNGHSTSSEFLNFHNKKLPEMVFIDGDHSMFGVMSDHVLVRKSANIIVHHDVCSIACPETTLFWSYLKNTEDNFDNFSFIDQYDSVNGSFLGIGVLKRKGTP
jgi:hypothetical protein